MWSLHWQWRCDAEEGGVDNFTCHTVCVLHTGVQTNLMISRDCVCLCKADNVWGLAGLCGNTRSRGHMKVTVFLLWLCVNMHKKESMNICILNVTACEHVCVWLHLQVKKHVPTTACVLERLNPHESVCKIVKMHVSAKRWDERESELAYMNLGLSDCMPRCHDVCVTVHLLSSS